MTGPRSLTAAQVAYIASRVGATPRSRHLLDSALARPLASAGGQDAYASVEERAAALLISLGENQPYLDGNKRVAYVCAAVLLRLHGWQLTASTDQVLALMTGLGRYKLAQVADWLREHRQRI